MKKILSLFSAIAMIATMFTTVAFADENNKMYWVREDDGSNPNSITLGFYITTEDDVISGGVYLDAQDMLDAGLTQTDLTISKKLSGSGTFAYNKNAKEIRATLTATQSEPYSAGDIYFGNITFDLTNATRDFSISVEKVMDVKLASDKSVVTDKFDVTGAAYTFAKAEEEDPKVTVAALEDGGKMYGMNTKVAEVSVPEGATASKATVTLGEESKTYDLPAGVKGQVGSFIAIIRYAADLVNPAFTLTVE
jgi:hypothetical protein